MCALLLLYVLSTKSPPVLCTEKEAFSVTQTQSLWKYQSLVIVGKWFLLKNEQTLLYSCIGHSKNKK